jgi:hypothetical protein
MRLKINISNEHIQSLQSKQRLAVALPPKRLGRQTAGSLSKDQQRTALFPGAAIGGKVYFPRSFVRLLGKEIVPFQLFFHDASCSYLTCQD